MKKYPIYYDGKQQYFIKAGTTEILEDEAMKLYEEGKYIVNYSGVYQLHYSNAQKMVYAHKVIEVKGLTLRGRYFVHTADEVNDLLGYNAVM